MNRKVLLFSLTLFIASAGGSRAQLVINEVQSSNFSTIQTENGSYEDWIELYNSGNAFINLGGYGLSDNPSKPYKFTFPPYLLAANDHVLIFADDTDQANAGAHWETAVKANDIWKYRVNLTAPPDTNWRNLSFSDTAWSSGMGGIGYGDGDDSTIVPACISVYMRKSFNISDTSKISDAIFHVDFDDGVVAYLNGVEIARVNVGSTGIRPAWNMMSFANYEARMYQGMEIDSFHIDKDFLHGIIRNGTNVLTIEVHNLNTSSSDLSCIPFLSFKIKDAGTMFGPVPSWFPNASHPKDYFHAAFKISKSGETIYLTNPFGTIADQVAVPYLENDNSYGRNTDGEATWKYFETTTPDTNNSLSTGCTGYATIPIFSLQGGFYTGTQTLTLTTNFPGGVIRYTTNGNTPAMTSTLYTAPIQITATTSIRARVFSSGGMPSQTVTNTYFINLNCKMPVYSLTLDSADLWDYNKGIFVLGPNASTVPPYYGANYWQKWEKFMSLEYFDKQKNRAFRFNAGLSITGGWSRRAGQKSLEVSLADKYGLSKIQYPMIPDKGWNDKWDDFLLHTTGNDRGYAHMRDPVMERLMKGTNSDYTAYEPCLVYINGTSWGVYHTKENDDANFVKANYGYGKNEIDFLKERSEEYPDIIVRNGDELAFKYMHAYAMNNTPSSPGFYAAMDSMIDIKNQVDYFAAETYYPNDDWMGGSNNNLKMWRPRVPGGRFRYVLYDLDFGFGMYGTVENDMLAVAMNPSPHNFNSDIFQRLLMNPQYKNYFINRYADLINTNWLPSNVLNVVNNFKDSMRYDMHFQFDKWGNGDTNTWKANINNVLTFSAARPAYARNQIQNDLGMAGQDTITLQASPAGAGRIQISTITPLTLPWSGVYFNGNPVTVTAIPNPGFTFNHWLSNVAITTADTNRSVTRNYTTNDTVTAYFTGSAINPLITVSEINYHSDSAGNAGDWVELHNLTSSSLDISGWKLRDDNDHHQFIFPVTTVIAPNGYLVIAEDLAKFHNRHPAVTNVIGETGFNFSDGGDQVRLFTYNDSLFLSMEYGDQDPWPVSADGGGYTLELLSAAGDLSDGNNWFAGCLGGSPGTAYSAPVSTITASGSSSVCAGDTLVLTASAANGNQYQWQKNLTDISGATSLTYMPSTSGTYTVKVTNNGCSAVSDSVVVNVIPRSNNPVANSASRCGTGTVTLTASAADSVFWYNAPNGTLLFAGNNFTTPSISQTTTYYARAGSVCPSSYIAVNAVVNSNSADPVTTGQARCGSGSVTLTATSSDTIRWYNAPNGSLLFTGPAFTTPSLNQTTTYYAKAGTLCPSNPMPAIATVNTVSSNPVTTGASRCGTGSVTLQATAADTIRWYTAPNGALLFTGNNFVTPSLNQTTTYYARAGTGCPSSYVAAAATINAISADPVTSDKSRCGPGTVTLTATSPDVIKWYDAPNGNILTTGNSFTTPSISQTTTYYLRAEGVCPGNFIPVHALVNTIPADPVAGNQNRCGSGTLTLTASGTDTLRWYSAPNGNLLATGGTFITPVLSQPTTYYVQAGGTCKSNFTPVTANVIANPAPPVTSDVSRCDEGSVTIYATSPDTVRWYDAPSGNLLYTGPVFQSPSLTSSTTYYIRAESNCFSQFVPVNALITDVTPDPVVADQSHCGNGTVTFHATATDTVRWFDAPGGTLLFTGVNFTTPVLTQNTTYFARSGTGCPSGDVEVHALINPVTPDPVTTAAERCGPGSVVLTATSNETVKWYDAPNGTLLYTGSGYTTPVLNQSATYYAIAGETCPSNFIQVAATIHPVTPDPVTTAAARCGDGSVTLAASSNQYVQWYDAPNGSLLYTGYNFTTPVLNQTTSYYATAGGTCPSNYVQVTATINPVTADPITTAASRCGQGSVTLTAASNESVHWYDAPNGTLLFTGNNFTTPSLNQTTSYFAISGDLCPSGFIEAVATINPVPADPQVTDISRCGPGSVVLTAAGTDTIRWYDAQGGNLLAEGYQFATPVLTQTTVYYVRAEGICTGNYVPAHAVVNPVPADATTADVSRCGPGSLTLQAASADTVRWYDAPNGNLLSTGNGFITPSLNATVVYYVRAEGICPGNFIPVSAIILPVPADPSSADQERCGPGSVTLSASGNDTLHWYDAPNGNQLGTGNSFLTPVIANSTTYYVRSENTCTSNFVSVQAVIKQLPEDPVVTGGGTCGAGSVTLTASSPDTVNWYDAPNGTLLGSGTTFQTPVINSTTPYYAEAVNGCEGNFIPVNAMVFTEPQVTLGNDTIIESGSTVVLDAGQGFVSYLWSTGSTAQTAVVNSTGNYTVTVTDSNGCVATDTIQVLVTVNVQPYVLSDGVLIYPNPTHSSLSISFMNENNEDVFLRLIESNGKLIWSDFSINEKRVMRSIDIEQYARGLYILQISNSKEKREYKVILN